MKAGAGELKSSVTVHPTPFPRALKANYFASAILDDQITKKPFQSMSTQFVFSGVSLSLNSDTAWQWALRTHAPSDRTHGTQSNTLQFCQVLSKKRSFTTSQAIVDESLFRTEVGRGLRTSLPLYCTEIKGPAHQAHRMVGRVSIQMVHLHTCVIMC